MAELIMSLAFLALLAVGIIVKWRQIRDRDFEQVLVLEHHWNEIKRGWRMLRRWWAI